MDKRAQMLILGIVIFFAVVSASLLIPRGPMDEAPDVTINPEASAYDTRRVTDTTLEGGGNNPARIGVSIAAVAFQTHGESICLFGNFTVVGDGNGLIDFFIVTNQGYDDLLDDGGIASEYIFDETAGTSGGYWNCVLPYFFEGNSVSQWYVLYSAYTKPGPFLLAPAEHRDINAETYQDLTEPNWYCNLPSTPIQDALQFSIWVWDDRCSTTVVTVYANGSSIHTWSGSISVYSGEIVWDTTSEESGVYFLTIYVEDEVGNHDTFYIGNVTVLGPEVFDPVQLIRPASCGLAFVSILMIFCVTSKNRIILVIRGSISIFVTYGSLEPVFGPLDFLSIIAGICGILSFLHVLRCYYNEYRVKKRYTPKRVPDYFT